LSVASLTATDVKTVEETSRFWYDTVAPQFARVYIKQLVGGQKVR
jgi:hypothetical protein